MRLPKLRSRQTGLAIEMCTHCNIRADIMIARFTSSNAAPMRTRLQANKLTTTITTTTKKREWGSKRICDRMLPVFPPAPAVWHADCSVAVYSAEKQEASGRTQGLTKSRSQRALNGNKGKKVDALQKIFRFYFFLRFYKMFGFVFCSNTWFWKMKLSNKRRKLKSRQ